MNATAKPSLFVLATALAAWCGSGIAVDSLGVPLGGIVVTRKSDGATTRTDVAGKWTLPGSSSAATKIGHSSRQAVRLRLEGGRMEYSPSGGRRLDGRMLEVRAKGLEPTALLNAGRFAAAADSVAASGKGWVGVVAAYDSRSDSNKIVIQMAGSRGMARIPGGFDSLGRKNLSNNLPHVARVAGLWMDTIEVTQALYDSLMKTNPSFHANCPTCPVERVTWYDAVRFCNARSRAEGLPEAYDISSPDSLRWTWNPSSPGFRLPTDTEWEYAARAGSSADWYWGTMIGPTTVVKYAWHNLNSGDSTNPVGMLLPNAFRLYDIAGNVTEWTWDWSQDYTQDSLHFYKGPSGIGVTRASRGGDFSSLGTDVSLSRRIPALPTSRWLALGFRCARGVMP